MERHLQRICGLVECDCDKGNGLVQSGEYEAIEPKDLTPDKHIPMANAPPTLTLPACEDEQPEN
jgi:hypothetical protein